MHPSIFKTSSYQYTHYLHKAVAGGEGEEHVQTRDSRRLRP